MLSGKLERREWQVVNKFFGSSASKKLKHLRLICPECFRSRKHDRLAKRFCKKVKFKVKLWRKWKILEDRAQNMKPRKKRGKARPVGYLVGQRREGVRDAW